MTLFCEVLKQAILLLNDRAKLAAGEGEQLESSPWVRFDPGSEVIFGSFAECDAENLVLNTYEQEVCATKHIYSLGEFFERGGTVEMVKLWVNGWRSRGGYFGETKEEYGGDSDPGIGRTVAEVELRRTPGDGWTIVDQK